MQHQPEAGRAMVGGDVGCTGSPRRPPGDEMRALVMAHGHIRPPPFEVEGLADRSQVEPTAHPGTRDRQAAATQVLEELALILEGDQPGRETALG